jgi:hypothetical protein
VRVGRSPARRLGRFDLAIARPLGAAFVTLLFLLVGGSAYPQSLGPAADVLLGNLVSDRVQAFVILGGAAGLTGGVFGFDDDSDPLIQIIKVGGDGTLTEPMPLGIGTITWAPIVRGNFGYLWADNTFGGTPLDGNHSRINVFGMEAGGGARFYLSEHVSIAPKLSLIYGRVWNDFSARNAAGRQVEQVLGGALVGWSLNSILVTPAVDMTVQWKINRNHFTFTSDYRYFAARSFGETSPFVTADGDSHVWINKMDVDFPIGRKLFGREMYTGGYYSRLSFFDDVNTALDTGHLNEIHARFALDFLDLIPRVKWMGVGGSYFWGAGFGGFAIGVDFRVGD